MELALKTPKQIVNRNRNLSALFRGCWETSGTGCHAPQVFNRGKADYFSPEK